MTDTPEAEPVAPTRGDLNASALRERLARAGYRLDVTDEGARFAARIEGYQETYVARRTSAADAVERACELWLTERERWRRALVYSDPSLSIWVFR